MSATRPTRNTIDIQIDNHRSNRRRRYRPSIACSSGTTTEGSTYFSDSGDDEPRRSTGSHGECRSTEVEVVSKSQSSISELLSEIDLESGELERQVHYYSGKKKRKRKKMKVKKDEECRICQVNLVGRDEDESSGGGSIQLGCKCKGDLGAAHKRCAETWFKIKGNYTCEICGHIALNISAEQTNEANNTEGGPGTEATTTAEFQSETQSFFDGRRIMNILLACMILAFVISWLFHFHVFG